MAYEYLTQSLSTSHFTGALATAAKEDEDIVLPPHLAGVGGTVKSRIKSLTVISKENLAWEVDLYTKDSYAGAGVDTNTFLARWSFVAGDAVQIAAAGDWLYYIDGLDQAYNDDDRTGELHVRLVNRSVASKTAGANGGIVVKFGFEPMNP